MPEQQQQVVEVSKSDLDAIAKEGMVQGGGLMTALFTLIAVGMKLRRRFWHDSLEVKRDRVEVSMMELLMKERNEAQDNAREAWEKKAEDAQLIGQLKAEVSALRELNHKTNNEVQLLRLVNEKQNEEIKGLRQDMVLIRDQIRSCQNCPLRGVPHEATTHQ